MEMRERRGCCGREGKMGFFCVVGEGWGKFGKGLEDM